MFIFTVICLLSICIILIISAVQRFKIYLAIKKCLPHNITVEKLTTWYYGTNTFPKGLFTPSDDDVFVKDKVDNPLYGELTYEGMKALMKKLRLSTSDVFYDLGCGMGKLVLYTYLAKPIKKSVGIEMIGQRYRLANMALGCLVEEGLLDPKRELSFIHNNIRNENFSDATVIFMSSLCFPTDLMEELDQKFSKLKRGLRVVSLIPLPEHTRLSLIDEGRLPMTWTNNSWVYYYERL